ncbi:MAG: lysylphosphatidylglycerol synthase transmembrane domain-containing protein [Candidatus Zixiibacteriota bacterium]
MTFKKALIVAVKTALTAFVLYFVVRQVVVNWSEIRQQEWHFNYAYLLLSVLAALGSFAVFAATWRKIIAGFGHEVSAPMAFKISYLSNLARYIPGKVWQVFGMLYLAGQAGVTAEAAGASFVISEMFAIPASFLVFVLAAFVEPLVLTEQVAVLGRGSAWLMVIGLLALCALLVLYPQPLLKVGNWLLVKIGRPPVKFTLDKKVALVILVGYFLGWIAQGIAFWFFLLAVLPEQSPGVVAAAGIYNGAYQIGYVMIFAPGGFGPRELVLGTLLSPYVGAVAPALALLVRLWSLVVETAAALAAAAIRK